MSQSIITTAFERWKAQESIDGNLIVLDEFVFAYIPNLEIEKPIDRNEGLPDAKYIVHRQTVNKTGVVNQNAVAYSVTIGAEIGDFDFNWIGILNKKSGTVAMIVHAPTQRKIKTQAGQQGNVLTRSFLLEYLGASKETAITTPAEMWQIDFTARLSGIDEMQRLVNTDSYGEASFFDDAFLVAKTGNQYFVTKGIGYIGGLRAELITNQNITVPAENTKVYADVSYQGDITSRWQTHIKLTVKPDLKNYIDNAGFAHFVFAIASISADGKITDLRPKGTLDFQQLDDALKAHEKSRNHPDATLKEKGFTTLNNQVGDSQNTALTPFGAQEALKKYQPKGNYADGGRFSVHTESSVVRSPNSLYTLEIQNDGRLLVTDVTSGTPKAVIRFTKDGELSIGSVPVCNITGVSQNIGDSASAIMSQKASTDAFQMKGDYADKSTSIPQSFNAAIMSNKDILSVSGNVKIGLKAGEKEATLILDAGNGWKIIKLQDRAGTLALVGDSYLKSESDFQLNEIKNNVYSKSATDSFLNKKVDKENISQQLANDVNKVPSLDLVTRELGKKQASGNYADKSSSATQSFSSPIIALNEVMSRNGNISLGIKTEGKPAVVFNFGTIWRTLSFQDKDGTIALSGDSYTKAESNKQLDDIKNNVYSKSASDGKYGLKNTISKLDNGWWKCGDTGLIYQYGIVSGCVSSDESRSFPIPFPNKCLSMVGGYLNENEWGQGISMRVIDNKTFFSVVRSASGGWSAARAYYIAIGY
ncbi:TPA: phage tail protein [Proteus mirabilis]|nr:phage tail protein [Proteus mirabilis]